MKKGADFLIKITRGDSLEILTNLYENHPSIRKLIRSEAEDVLKDIDIEDVAEDVYSDLDGIQVEELWDRSGANRYGYTGPEEMAVEMIEELLRHHHYEIKKYLELNMTRQAKKYCMGVLSGIYHYDHESESEFKDWAADIPGECFSSFLEDWKKSSPNKNDAAEMQAFIAEECPSWSRD